MRAAVERVGGDEAVREALAPKQRSDGQTMKWSAVCAEAAQGLSPGDPVFTAWARLAVTPVREIKALVDPRDRDGRGGAAAARWPARRPARRRRRRRRAAATGRGATAASSGGYAGAEDMRQHGRDGSFKTRIRIIDMSKDRDEKSGGQRARRRAKKASDRLDRLGY